MKQKLTATYSSNIFEAPPLTLSSVLGARDRLEKEGQKSTFTIKRSGGGTTTNCGWNNEVHSVLERILCHRNKQTRTQRATGAAGASLISDGATQGSQAMSQRGQEWPCGCVEEGCSAQATGNTKALRQNSCERSRTGCPRRLSQDGFIGNEDEQVTGQNDSRLHRTFLTVKGLSV